MLRTIMMVLALSSLAGSPACSLQWSSPQNLMPGDVGGSWTSGGGVGNLALQGDTVYLVWYNASAVVVDMGHQVYFTLYDGTSWQAGQMISPLVNWRRHSWFPACALDRYGDLHVVWETNDFVSTGVSIYDIGYRKLSRGSWSSPVNVTGNTVQGYSWHPAIGCGADGRIHIVWQDNRRGTFRIFYRQIVAGAWSNMMCLDSAGVYSTLPSLAMLGSEVAVAWQDFRDGISQIYLRMTSGGIWGNNDSCLSGSPSGAYFPVLASDSAGNLHLAWEDTRDGNFEIYYRKYHGSTGSWGPVTRLTSDPYNSRQPTLVSWGDGSGNVNLFWTDDRLGSYEIYSRLLQDDVWQPETMITTADGQASLYPAAAAGGGGINLVWTDFSPRYQLPNGEYYNSPDIFYMKGAFAKGAGSSDQTIGRQSPAIRFVSASPNPSSNGGILEFAATSAGDANVTIYNIAGQKIRQLFKGKMGEGGNRIFWDSRDDFGNKVANGVYLVKLEMAGGTTTGKMLILR